MRPSRPTRGGPGTRCRPDIRRRIYEAALIDTLRPLARAVNYGSALTAEYTYNRELGRIPQFPDDVVTSSLVVKY